jgi:copper chaperone CopZ
MNTKKYNVLGMSCEGCQKKISSALNNVEGIKESVQKLIEEREGHDYYDAYPHHETSQDEVVQNMMAKQ